MSYPGQNLQYRVLLPGVLLVAAACCRDIGRTGTEMGTRRTYPQELRNMSTVTNTFLRGTRIVSYEDGHKVREAAINKEGKEFLVITYDQCGRIIDVWEDEVQWPSKSEGVMY